MFLHFSKWMRALRQGADSLKENPHIRSLLYEQHTWSGITLRNVQEEEEEWGEEVERRCWCTSSHA